MFKLPTCPHCGTIYRYKDVKAAIKQKENTCYHCQKRFRAKRFPYALVGILIPVILCILLNMYLMTRMRYLELIPLFAVTLFFLAVAYVIIPFFTKFKKLDEDTENKNKRKGKNK